MPKDLPKWLCHFIFPSAIYEGSCSLNLCQHLLLSFFIIVILAGIKWRIIVVSIYIFLMGNDVQDYFMCSLPITMPLLLNPVMLTLSKSWYRWQWCTLSSDIVSLNLKASNPGFPKCLTTCPKYKPLNQRPFLHHVLRYKKTLLSPG